MFDAPPLWLFETVAAIVVVAGLLKLDAHRFSGKVWRDALAGDAGSLLLLAACAVLGAGLGFVNAGSAGAALGAVAFAVLGPWVVLLVGAALSLLVIDLFYRRKE